MRILIQFSILVVFFCANSCKEKTAFVKKEAGFPGGFAKMSEFIQKKLVYPQRAIENNIQGRCIINFVVDENGAIRNARVKSGVKGCPECDRAALWVIKKMPRWTPEKLDGKYVATVYSIPINFELE